MMSQKSVLIVGGTGRTGQAITKALLQTNKFKVIILVRATSAEKPIVQEFRDAGVEIRIGDIFESPENIEPLLQGVDILISTVLALTDQKPLLLAAKRAGVGRVIPSDFGPHAPRGVMSMHDTKLDIREYIKELGLPYTFIEVGWWLQLLFPYPHATPVSVLTPKTYIGDRQQKLAYTTIKSLASLVARIVDDPRTLNRTVLASDGETNVEEAWAMAEKVSGEDFSDYTRVPDEEIFALMKSNHVITRLQAQYANSLYLRGDNTLAKAVADGVLVARDLYPDAPVFTIEAAAKEFYDNPPEYDVSAPELN